MFLSTMTSSTLRGGSGKLKCIFFVVRGTVTRSILAIAFKRLCTWVAFVALERNLSTNRISFLILMSWRRAVASRTAISCSLASTYSSYVPWKKHTSSFSIAIIFPAVRLRNARSWEVTITAPWYDFRYSSNHTQDSKSR